MAKKTTFRNLQTLEHARVAVRENLGEQYDEVIAPFRRTIEMVAEANSENHFEAMKRIQDDTRLMNTPEKTLAFSAALMEIVEEKNLQF